MSGFKLPSQPTSPAPGVLKSAEKEPVNEPSEEPEGDEELEKESEGNEAEKEKPASENKPSGILT